MSEMMPVRLCVLSIICARYCWRRASGQPGCIASRARPSRPLSGVRISWLVLARKALLARLAASAASRASASACCVWRRSVMSSAVQMVPPPIGLLGSTDCACRRAQNSVPSRRRFELRLALVAVLLAQLADGLLAAQALEPGRIGPQRAERGLAQLLLAVAEHLAVARVDAHDALLAHEGDRQRDGVEDGLDLQPASARWR